MTTPAAPAPRLHIDYIDGMRAVAALVVVLNHSYGQAWCAFYGQFPPPNLSFLTYSLAIGHLAVSVFIVISGFCLFIPVARAGGVVAGGPLLFFKRRARRILPPYYAAVALCLLLIATVLGGKTGSLWDVSADVRKLDVVSHLLMLQNLFGTGRINYVFWSIALEWQIYFLFPLLVLAFRRWSVAGTILASLAVGYALTLSGIHRIDHANYHYLGLFTLGMAAARVAFSRDEALVRLKERGPWRALAAATLLPATGLILAWGWKTAIARWPLLDLIVGLGTVGLLLAAARSAEGLVSRVFSVRLLAWIGRFSYSLYLIHAPILQLLWLFVLKPAGLEGPALFAALLGLGLPLIIGLSYLFFLAFEKPFIGAPKKQGQASHEPAPLPRPS